MALDHVCRRATTCSRTSHPHRRYSIAIGEHFLRYGAYVSIVIDSQRAIWNERYGSSSTDLARDLEPSDIDRIELWKPGTAPSVFHICPGVNFILISTKAKHWHPSQRPE